MWHALADIRGLRPPSVPPNHLAAPWRRRAPWDVPPPLGEGFGIPNRWEKKELEADEEEQVFNLGGAADRGDRILDLCKCIYSQNATISPHGH
jgi:hypothetical protein